jgi:geranylgeranyl diphosphate synthase type II
MALLAAAGGAPSGLVAGQAWESEATPPLVAYHRAKTGSLFRAAAAMGAVAAGADAAPWFALGDALGDAYQVADDLLDAAGTSAEAGKPIGQDSALLRPNAVSALGIEGCLDRFEGLVRDAIAAVPPCVGADGLRALVEQIAVHLVPQALRRDLRQRAA